MTKGLRIDTGRQFQQWTLAARNLAGGFVSQRGRWQATNDAFFELTQAYVHVITGRLKRSGRRSIRLEGVRVVAEVEYTASYAQAEIDRGGDHDFMGRAWEASQGSFQATFGDSWGRALTSWRLL
jgi:hypothetical protein